MVDFIHVVEYLRKAAWCVAPKPTRRRSTQRLTPLNRAASKSNPKDVPRIALLARLSPSGSGRPSRGGNLPTRSTSTCSSTPTRLLHRAPGRSAATEAPGAHRVLKLKYTNGIREGSRAMQVPIPTLRAGSPTHAMAIGLYQGHHPDAYGDCVRCGHRAPCPVRTFAASVIAAAGQDPRWYDGQLTAPTPPPAGDQPRPVDPQSAAERNVGKTLPNHYGYAVGGRTTRMISDGSQYEREL
jgi:hypothetical protein